MKAAYLPSGDIIAVRHGRRPIRPTVHASPCTSQVQRLPSASNENDVLSAAKVIWVKGKRRRGHRLAHRRRQRRGDRCVIECRRLGALHGIDEDELACR